MNRPSGSLAAEKAFYQAFEAGDIDLMMTVWAPLPDIRCIHPLGTLLEGPRDIRASWVAIFQEQVIRRFELERMSVWQGDDLAIHTLLETIVLPLYRQRFPPMTTTNVYRKVNNEWRMVLHHASPVGVSDDAVARLAADSPATRH